MQQYLFVLAGDHDSNTHVFIQNLGCILLNLSNLLNSENGRLPKTVSRIQKDMNSENMRALRKNSKFANKF